MKTTQRKVIAVFLYTALAAALTGCGRPGAGDRSDILIYGGQAVEDGSWSHVVAVTSRNQDGSHSIECSATLISPKHVLTAGHCLDLPGLLAGQPDAVGKVGVYIGSGQEGGKVTEVLPVAAVHVHPSLRLHPGGNADIAVITMKDPVGSVRPTGIVASVDQLQTLVQENSVVKLLGFGWREDGGKGRKFMTDTTARSVRAWESTAGAEGRDSCQGDSGGPGFVQSKAGTWLQYGIVSRSTSFACGSGGVMTNIAPHACWLTQVTGLRFPGTKVQCATPPAYSSDDLKRIDFQRLCRGGKSANVFQQETLGRLKRRFQTDDCEVLAGQLNSPVLKLDDLLLRDLSPLAPFTQIGELVLTGNQVSRPEVLLHLTGLKKLSLAGNDLTDPATEMAPLIAAGTRISGMRAQIGNYSQTEFLRLCTSPDVSPGVKLTIAKIKFKTMADDCVTANTRLLMLTTMNLSDRGITDLTPLAGLPYLKALDLSGNPVTDVSPLAAADSLRSLTLSNTDVTDLSPLNALVADGLVIKQ